MDRALRNFVILVERILTNVPDRINDTVELKVASKVFKVRVCEFNPCFTPNSAWCSEEEESNFSTSDDAVENNKLSNAKGLKASSSVASSKSNRSHPPVSKKDIKCPRVVEDINYACMGKLFEDSVDSFENTEERFIGEPEILGCKPNVEMPSVVDGGNISNENYNRLYQGKGKNIINDNILDDLNSLGYRI
ncbi:hypothetical protein V6N13_000203 [Hibiscus sabdariffa]